MTLIAELLIKLVRISELNKLELVRQFTHVIVFVKTFRNESTVN